MLDGRLAKVCKWCGRSYIAGHGKARMGDCGRAECREKTRIRRREVENGYRRRMRAIWYEREKQFKLKGEKKCKCGTRFNGRGDFCLGCRDRKARVYYTEGNFLYA